MPRATLSDSNGEVNSQDHDHSPNHPSTRSRFRLIPICSPHAFPPDCNLLSIKYDKDTKNYSIDSSTEDTQYITGESFITMRRFPAVALRNIYRIQARIDTRKVGTHPLVSASIAYGINYLASNNWVEELVKLNLRHKMSGEKLPGVINKMIQDSLSKYDISTPEGTYLNPQIHERTNNRLTSLAVLLGVNRASLASLAICHTVSDQINTNEDDSKEMIGYVERFFEASKIRGMALRALMDTFGIPEIREEEIV